MNDGFESYVVKSDKKQLNHNFAYLALANSHGKVQRKRQKCTDFTTDDNLHQINQEDQSQNKIEVTEVIQVQRGQLEGQTSPKRSNKSAKEVRRTSPTR